MIDVLNPPPWKAGDFCSIYNPKPGQAKLARIRAIEGSVATIREELTGLEMQADLASLVRAFFVTDRNEDFSSC
jgi:hypothetical protein